MIYKEISGNLFSYAGEYYLAHCIGADFAMSKGIAAEFNKTFDLYDALVSHYTKNAWEGYGRCLCLPEIKVFNLIVKKKYYSRPLYCDLHRAMTDMRLQAYLNDIDVIAMPRICCGYDHLSWEKVHAIIVDVFCKTEVTIMIVNNSEGTTQQ
jgi:hypothetical protein